MESAPHERAWGRWRLPWGEVGLVSGSGGEGGGLLKRLLRILESLTLLVEIGVLAFKLLLLGFETLVRGIELLCILEKVLVLLDDGALNVELVLKGLVLAGEVFAEGGVVNRSGGDVYGSRTGGATGGVVGAWAKGFLLADRRHCSREGEKENAGGEKTHKKTSRELSGRAWIFGWNGSRPENNLDR
jgi:hypothetical protein